ncbi:MAG: M13 family metallopeptidase [Thermoplasmata archaeon]
MDLRRPVVVATHKVRPRRTIPAVDAPSEAAPLPRDRVPRFSVDYMDRSTDPATDFYRFAAGRWLDQNPVPPDQARWSAFDELRERNFQQVRGILVAAAASPRSSRSSPRLQVGDFFASALDGARRERAGFRPIERELGEIRTISSGRALIATLAGFHSQGIPGIFGTAVAADEKNSSIYALYLVQGGLSLPDREYYLNDTFSAEREAYQVHVAKVLALLGEPPARAAVHAETVGRIETELAKASRSRTELRDADKNYHRFTIDEIAQRHPALRWREYLSARGAGKAPYVVVGQPEFFDTVNRLVGDGRVGDWRVYLRWQLLHSSAPHLHPAIENEDFDFFHRRLLGQPEPEPGWKRAAIVIDRTIGEALGRLYVQRYFPPEARDRMVELVEDLKEVFRHRLERVPWMTDETRARALAKFDRFTAKIGHPQRFRDYSRVRISRRDYVGNIRRAAAFEIRRRIVRVGSPVDRTEWNMTPPTVNAYFEPTLNEIVFPAGILQPPFFDAAMDDAVNYGGIGVVIGHEITHGYDDQGRKYDADGNLRDWWLPADAREFRERAQRIVDQYSEFEPLPGAHVNGELTMGENIADLGGLGIAFEALRRRLADGRSRRETIDGLTPEQRFFIAYGQIWRSNVREAELRRRLTTDPHAPGRFRAVGPVSNLPEFWNSFGIGEGAPMRRPVARRVSIW